MSRGFTEVTEDLLSQWQTSRHRVLRGHAGRSALHAWRICSRRLFALEELLAPSRQRGGTLMEEMHAAFHASGRLRDAQVAIRRLDALASGHPAASRLARHLRQGLPRRRKRMTKRLRHLKPRTLRRKVLDWRGRRPAGFERLAAARAAQRLAREARRASAAVGRPRTPRALHRRRIGLKTLRYMTQICRMAGCAGGSTWQPRTLAGLQSALGEITDIQVLLQYIATYGRRHRHWYGRASPLRVHLQEQRKHLLDRLP